MNWPDDFINKIICGDNLSVMKEMPDESINMVITSPPYFGLRDYGFEQIFRGDPDCKHKWGDKLPHPKQEKRTIKQLRSSSGLSWNRGENASIFKWQEYSPKNQGNFCLKCQAWKGQLGLEPTPELYVEHLTEIFNEAKRVLKKEGTLWLNCGDTYNSNPSIQQYKSQGGIHGSESMMGRQKRDIPNLPSKCLCMIPERLAWSLIQNGWIQRNKIIWIKPNCMPSSAKDRYTTKYEFVYYFVKSQRNYFDLDSIREPHSFNRWSLSNPIKSKFAKQAAPGQTKHSWQRKGHAGYYDAEGNLIVHPLGKNPGDIWTIPTVASPFPGVHFATFPEELCKKAIIPGSPEEVCKKCGKARERIIEKLIDPTWKPKYESRYGNSHKCGKMGNPRSRHRNTAIEQAIHTERKTIGWTSCNCKAGFEGGIVLDPFCGVGTALYVAKQLRRRFIGIDIKKEYCELAEKRLAQGVL